MAQPTAYTRQFNFSNFQSVNPDEPLPANQVDAELNAVKTNLDGLNQNIAGIQRNDGKLANQSVHPEAVSNATLTVLNSSIRQRGAWVTATAYAVNDLVTESSKVYLCLVAHTSGTFATDLSNAKWALLTSQGIAPDGTTTVTANIPMSNFKFTGLGNGSARTDSVNLGQVQDMSVQWGAVSGTANAIVLTLTPPVTTYVSGQTVKFKATGNNSGATTVNWGGGVIAVQYNGAALVGGEIKTGRTYELTYDGAVAQLTAAPDLPLPISNGGTGQTSASAAFDALKQAATDAAPGVVELALLSEVKTGAAGKVPTTDQIPQAMYIGRRNKLINGDFRVWQRGAGGAATFNTPASGTYLADRWACEYDGTIGTFVANEVNASQGERATVVAINNSSSPRFFRWNQTAAGSGQTLKKLRQRIETLEQFQSAKLRISFLGKVATGTADVSVYTKYGYGTGGAPTGVEAGPTAGAFTLTTTLQKFAATLTIDSFSGKTFGTDGPHTSYLEVGFDLPLNSTFDIRLYDVQLEFGEVTTPFDRRSFAEELRDCQRYFWKTFPYATAPAQNAGISGALFWRSTAGAAAGTGSPPMRTPVPMRTASWTGTTYNPSAANAQVRNYADNADGSTTSVGVDAEGGFHIIYTSSAASAVNEENGVHVTGDAEL